jgi:hypothetical protein
MMCPLYPTPENYLKSMMKRRMAVEVRSEINLLSPIEEALQVWKHCNVALWLPCIAGHYQTPIPSNQYLLLVAKLVPYTQTNSQCGTGLQELIQQNSQHKETFCLLCLTILRCLNSMEDNNDSPTTRIS